VFAGKNLRRIVVMLRKIQVLFLALIIGFAANSIALAQNGGTSDENLPPCPVESDENNAGGVLISDFTGVLISDRGGVLISDFYEWLTGEDKKECQKEE
jgi:hypothetical protein